MVSWSISGIKQDALAALSRQYWPCVLAGLISLFVSGGCPGGGGRINSNDLQALSDLGSEADASASLSTAPSDPLAREAFAAVAEKLAEENPAWKSISEAAAGSAGEDSAADGGDGADDPVVRLGDDGDRLSIGRVGPAFFIGGVVGGLFLVQIVGAVSFCWTFFLAGPLSVGIVRFFLRARRGRGALADIGWAFDRTRYWTVARATFVWTLSIALRTMCFIVPGVIAAYRWRCLPYLLVDDARPLPTTSALSLLRCSDDLTNGHKWHMAWLDASFLGWWILAVFTCGILAVFFVTPYVSLAGASLYDALAYGDASGAPAGGGSAGTPPPGTAAA